MCGNHLLSVRGRWAGENINYCPAVLGVLSCVWSTLPALSDLAPYQYNDLDLVRVGWRSRLGVNVRAWVGVRIVDEKTNLTRHEASRSSPNKFKTLLGVKK